MTASLDICHFLPLLFVGYFPLCDVIRLSWALFRVINKSTRHLGQKCRGDHSPRTQSPLLANMLHLFSDGNFARSLAGRPRMFVSPHTRYWAGPFPLHGWSPGQNWPTHIYIYITETFKTSIIFHVSNIYINNNKSFFFFPPNTNYKPNPNRRNQLQTNSHTHSPKSINQLTNHYKSISNPKTQPLPNLPLVPSPKTDTVSHP